MTSPFLVGEPSWYLVKSTMCSRRLAGHSSNESRVIGKGSSPPSSAISVHFMHCWPSSMRYCPCSSASVVPSEIAVFGPVLEVISLSS